MSKTDNKTHIRNGIHRLCRQTSRLNLYVQNAKVLNMVRIAKELKQLSNQLEELSNQPQMQGECLSQEE
jgi:RNase P protein component